MKNECMMVMQKRLWMKTLVLVTSMSGVLCGPALAQNVLAQQSGLTPRDRVVVSLLTGQLPLNIDPAETNSQLPLAPQLGSFIEGDDIIEGGGLSEAAASEPLNNNAVSDAVITLDGAEQAALPPISIDIPLPSAGITFEPAAGRYGFFQTAPDYMQGRGQEKAPQLKLRYRVVKADAMTGIASPPEMVTLLIGADYAAISRGDGPMQIFDFKTRRLLTVTADAPEHFTNVSLYAARYKNIDTVRRMTKGGQLRSLSQPQRGRRSLSVTAKPKGLNAFYLESSLGWAAAPLPKGGADALSLSTADTVTTAKFDGKDVFTGNFNGPNFDVPTQGYSLISVFYHLLPIHPEVLEILTNTNAAPTSLKLYTESPNAPSGQTESWTLTDTATDDVPFPLPKTALSVTELDTVSPLAFVMTEALHGRALGGPPDSVATLAAMEGRLEAGDVLAVWLSANAMSDRIGGCGELKGLCDMTARARARGGDNVNLSDLFAAFDNVAISQNRIGALMTLQEAVADPDAPGIILRKTALGLAKLKRSQIVSAGLSELNAETLLTQAIAKDPYDYAAYQGLAQVYAARGAFIESWDMSDALRAFPDAPDIMTDALERAEQTLARGAPGFFPPLQP